MYSVAWSPDGKSLATAGFDYTVRLWDVGTRKEIKKLDGHTKLVLAVAISPDGKRVLSGSQDKTAKIWEWPVFSPTKTFAGHPGAVQALAVKPDGKLVAAAAGRSVKIWDLATGQTIKEVQGHDGDVQSVAWRGDGGGLATGDKAHGIRLWKADLNHEATIESPGEGVLALAYLPNNQQLASAGSDGLGRLWQLPAIAPRTIDPKGAVDVFAISRDGTKLATAGGDKVIRLWNTADGKSIKEIADRRAGGRRCIPARRVKTGGGARDKKRADLPDGGWQGGEEDRRAARGDFRDRLPR